MDPPKILAVIDFGSTGPRAAWSLASAIQPHLCYLEPDAIEVPAGSIDRYLRNEIGDPRPEDAAWVDFEGRRWALGRLARQCFGGEAQLQPPKIDLAVCQTLGVVGAICQRRNFPQRFDLELGVLLPLGEYPDRERLRERLTAALASFSFRGRDCSGSLVGFHARPEGSGLLAYGVPQDILNASRQQEIGVAVVGFRNSSRFAIRDGQRRGETDDLGFSYVTRRVQQSTSGQRFDDPYLIAAASLSAPKQRAEALARLARSCDPQVRAAQAEEIARAVETAREEYFQNLARRFRAFFATPPQAIVLGGGTAWSCRADLRAALRPIYPRTKLEFCAALRQRCQETLKAQLSQRRLPASRMLDAYGYFLMLLETEFARAREVVASR